MTTLDHCTVKGCAALSSCSFELDPSRHTNTTSRCGQVSLVADSSAIAATHFLSHFRSIPYQLTMAPGYGTVSDDTRRQNGSANAADEESALLSGKPNEQSIAQRFQKHMTENVSNSWGDIALLGSYIITGLLDSCSVFIWGSFLSMQTGESSERQTVLHIQLISC